MTEKLHELLTAFGEELANSEAVAEYREAKEAYMRDETVNGLIREFNVQHMLLDAEEKKEEPNKELLESLNDRIKVLTEEIQANKAMERMRNAETQLDILLAEVNQILTGYINPQTSCSGSCGTCGGCH